MSFHVRPFNHSPQWYHAHCGAEDGGSAAFRAMLNADMKFLDADNDKTLTYEERIGIYEDAWNDIFKGKKGNADAADLQEVMEREGVLGFRPQVEYSRGGFKAIAGSMKKYGIAPNDVRKFLEWKAKNENAKKARASKPIKKVKKKATNDEFFESAEKEAVVAKANSVVAKNNVKKSNIPLASEVKPEAAIKNIEITSADFD